ncbi:MarR family transcriptional regulator [Streptomyces purpurogeneiscleroticus]|uniref:MarR family transcriptional regulator n=1 Tax=Streptomyces purpurogeneiscleroticus TaxID=68259 RepID=UPI001CC177AF|nr:MarR family transcriptional regulator [Streptomyces purpurogeneiscleroticus]MBZ4020422.1 transcriptional regulator [Streptomyces purpurogeneiscleroticus]
MSEDAGQAPDDVDAVTRAVLTASRVLVAVSARSLASVEGTVTLPQFRLLVALSTHGAAKLVVVAELLRVNPSTAMRMIDRLIGAGFVDRRVNPDNRRETIVQLTEAGRHLVEDVTARRQAEIAEIVGRMPASERASIVAALTAFASAAGEPPVAGSDPYPLGWAAPSTP